MKKWDKSNRLLCPEKYCFFWGKNSIHNGELRIEEKCDEAYRTLSGNDCIRRPKHQIPAIDFYEQNEPALRQDGLPDNYFINNDVI